MHTNKIVIFQVLQFIPLLYKIYFYVEVNLKLCGSYKSCLYYSCIKNTKLINISSYLISLICVINEKVKLMPIKNNYNSV